MSPQDLDDLRTVGAWLARRDVDHPADRPAGTYDVVVLCGSAVLATVDVAVAALRSGAARRVLVTGGVGHSTPLLVAALAAHPRWSTLPAAGRTEAAVLAEVLVDHLDVPAELVSTEQESTNCGENAQFSLRVLAEDAAVRRMLLVQDPTMQRRTHAGFDHHQRSSPHPLEVLSHAPFVPEVGPDGVGAGGRNAWDLDRFASLALGEVRRLHDDEHGYGPRGAGFLGHVDVPAGVLAAARRVADRHPALAGR